MFFKFCEVALLGASWVNPEDVVQHHNLYRQLERCEKTAAQRDLPRRFARRAPRAGNVRPPGCRKRAQTQMTEKWGGRGEMFSLREWDAEFAAMRSALVAERADAPCGAKRENMKISRVLFVEMRENAVICVKNRRAVAHLFN